MDKDLAPLLRTFCAVVEAGSLSAAANRLSVQPPAVSKSLARLETLLGKRLLNRTTRAVEITEVGRYVHAEGLKHLLAQEVLLENVRAFDQTPSGTLTVTATPAIGDYLIAPSLADFSRHYPRVTVNLLLDNALVRLPSQNIDVAIRSSRTLEDSTLTSRKLFEATRVVVASPAYLEKAGAPQKPEEIARHACLNFQHGKLYDQWDYFHNDVHHELSTRTLISANSYATLKILCMMGMGVARLFAYQVNDELEHGDLVRVAKHTDWGRQFIHAVYHGKLQDSPKVQAFLAHLCAQGTP